MAVFSALAMTLFTHRCAASSALDMDAMIFADMQSGAWEKEVTIKGSDMVIKPHGNNQTWAVNANLDLTLSRAIVDFNVPGMDDPPPVPLQVQLFTSVSARGSSKTTFLFTDDSGEIVDDPKFPLNQWVGETVVAAEHKADCPQNLQAIFHDMHDDDRKLVTIAGEKMTIMPSGNDQEWMVHGNLDRESCSAVIDFNVPGHPDFPFAFNFTVTYWFEYERRTYDTLILGGVFEFTDQTGALAPAAHPLNRLVPLPLPSSEEVVVV